MSNNPVGIVFHQSPFRTDVKSHDFGYQIKKDNILLCFDLIGVGGGGIFAC